MDLRLHDIVELKKPHPCGAKQWEILRTGMDIKLRCQGCGHEIMVLRSKAEKSIRKIVGNTETPEDADTSAVSAESRDSSARPA